jgi:UDP-glucuronate decarboxylase
MKVLLTGAAGFLGSNLALRLIAGGHSIIGIDDLSTGNVDNFKTILNNPNFKFIEHDVRNPFITDADAILNFACPASPISYQQDPIRTIETSFLGTRNLLKLASKTGAIFIQASTSEVYGDPLESPQKETYWGNVNPIGLRSCYDEGKRAAETLCFDYKRQLNVDARVIRIFNTYGPNMSVGDGRVVSNFIVQALKSLPISIYGNGNQTRSFCYVSDLIEGIYKLLLKNTGIDQPINLGNPVELSIIELAHLVRKITDSDSKIEEFKIPSDDPRQRKPDIEVAKKVLDWTPEVSLEVGLGKTIRYFKKILGY